MRVGPLGIGSISDWTPVEGSVVSWEPTAVSLAKAAKAPVSPVPPGYMQAQHIRGYRQQLAKGLDYSRLMVVSCDSPGQCDIRAMTYVVNAHLRRQDTYRSWFECPDKADSSGDGGGDDGGIVRHQIADPREIEFAPHEHGKLNSDEIRELVVSTPDPLNWDCFRFGIVQGPDSFTFYASIDHLHVDAMIVGVTLMEFFMMYSTLVAGGGPLDMPDAGSYLEFCERQQASNAALTLQSPEVRTWVEFAENNDNSLPGFPLPLGDTSVRWKSAMITKSLMDADEMASFEAACVDADARFIGGVLACIAYAQHQITGADSYYGLTPRDTRRDASAAMTQGWFTGLTPFTVPIAALSFADAARAAQESFDSNRGLANVPFDRVRELDPKLTSPPPNFPVINFLDAGTAPLSALLTAELGDMHIGVYSDGRYSYQMSIYIARVADETASTVMFPDNPVARESVERYLEILKSVFARVAEHGHWPHLAAACTGPRIGETSGAPRPAFRPGVTVSSVA